MLNLNVIIRLTERFSKKNFRCQITKTENVLKMWRRRQITLKGKVFKSLAVSKGIHNASTMSSISAEIIAF